MTPKEFLSHISVKYPDLLEGAAEYAYQFGQINHDEYRHWIEKMRAIEAQKTEQLLKVLSA